VVQGSFDSAVKVRILFYTAHVRGSFNFGAAERLNAEGLLDLFVRMKLLG
jgi:predicted amidohydrolase